MTTEAKFKVGDKVRQIVKSDVPGYNLDPTKVYTVSGARFSGIDLKENGEMGLDPNRFEKVTEETPEKPTKYPDEPTDNASDHFKSGDRVRCINDVGTTQVVFGRTYTVTTTSFECVTLADTPVLGTRMYHTRFEKVSDAASTPVKETPKMVSRDTISVGDMVRVLLDPEGRAPLGHIGKVLNVRSRRALVTLYNGHTLSNPQPSWWFNTEDLEKLPAGTLPTLKASSDVAVGDWIEVTRKCSFVTVGKAYQVVGVSSSATAWVYDNDGYRTPFPQPEFRVVRLKEPEVDKEESIKLGDWITVKDDGLDLTLGKAYQVCGIATCGEVMFRDDVGDLRYLDLDEVTKVPAPAPAPLAPTTVKTPEEPIKVGDWVRMTENDSHIPLGPRKGHEGEVLKIGGTNILITWGEGHTHASDHRSWWVPRDKLEKVFTSSTPSTPPTAPEGGHFIVVLKETDGAYLPATKPVIHTTRKSAEAEATRLTGIHHKTFVVFKAVTSIHQCAPVAKPVTTIKLD